MSKNKSRAKEQPAAQKTKKVLKELWQCPKCGEKFVTPNMWHSCGKYSLEALFVHSEPHVYQLYEKFEKLVKTCGPIIVIPQKSRIVFQVRVRFGGAVPRKSYLQCTFAFNRKYEHSRFYKIEQYAPHWYGHYFRIEKEDEFDDEFMNWAREAYKIGQQNHLTKDNAA